MAAGGLKRRLDALEVRAHGFSGPAVWLVLDPGEATGEGIARLEARHGKRQPGQPALIWKAAA